MKQNYFSLVKMFAIAALVTTITACGAGQSSDEVIQGSTLTITIKKDGTITAQDAAGKIYSARPRPDNADYCEFETKNPDNRLLYRVLFCIPTRTQIGTFEDKRISYRISQELKVILADGTETFVAIAESKQPEWPAVHHPWWAVYDLKDGKQIYSAKEPQTLGVQNGYIVHQDAGYTPTWKVDLKTGKRTPIPRK